MPREDYPTKDLCTTSEYPISIVFGPAWRDDATERSDYWFPDLTEECWSIECQDYNLEFFSAVDMPLSVTDFCI